MNAMTNFISSLLVFLVYLFLLCKFWGFIVRKITQAYRRWWIEQRQWQQEQRQGWQEQQWQPQEDTPSYYPYISRYLLTKTEYQFYKKLRNYTDCRQILVCPKVRLEDFIETVDRQNRLKYRGYIKSRHVDFLLCDNDLHILCGLELDDSSHNRQKAQKTDNFKDNLFKAINIPLYRIKVENDYDREIIAIMKALGL